MIIITGGFTATADSADVLRRAALDHVHRSRGEDGCISHDVMTDAENPLRFCFFERWRDMAAVRTHFGVPASAAFVRTLREHAREIEDLSIYEASRTAP